MKTDEWKRIIISAHPFYIIFDNRHDATMPYRIDRHIDDEPIRSTRNEVVLFGYVFFDGLIDRSELEINQTIRT